MFWVAAAIVLSVLIIVHEAGHYVVAKWCKMRVDRFSLGFGPALVGWRRNGTLFQIAPIPFGGFVEIRGMNIAEDVDPDDAYAYPNRPVWQRFLTIFAGPATNYLFAIVLAFVLFSAAGMQTGNVWYSIADVSDGFDVAGKLQPGDRIVSMKIEGDDAPVALGTLGYELPMVVQASQGRPLKMVVDRDGQELTFQIVPRKLEPSFLGGLFRATILQPAGFTPVDVYLLGIRFDRHYERVDVPLLTATIESLRYPVLETKRLAGDLYMIVTGQREGELTGPVGIASFIKNAIETSWVAALGLVMLLNVYLGLFNLLPLPALDGGRLAFLVYEMATRKRANPKIEAPIHMVGIMILMLVLVVVTFKDCVRVLG